MVSTRAHDGESSSSTGDKRAADASAHDGGSPKKVKKVVSSSHTKGEEKGDSTAKTEDETKTQNNEAGERAKKDDDEQPAEKRPDGMDEEQRDEEPQGPTAEGNAQPGEIPAHLPKEDLERKHGAFASSCLAPSTASVQRSPSGSLEQASSKRATSTSSTSPRSRRSTQNRSTTSRSSTSSSTRTAPSSTASSPSARRRCPMRASRVARSGARSCRSART